jgi:DNA primase
MPGTPVEEIKAKLDVVETLKGYLALAPAGKNFKANCPFHKEKTPSFMVSPERQSWHCFGCGLGGDIFTFVEKYENVEFGEALRILAEKAGVELRRANPAEYRVAGLLYDINDAAKRFYQKQLAAAEPARKYLGSRKLNKETVLEFELGFAPNGREDLTLYLLKAGFAPDDVVRAGLTGKSERGMLFDRFRGRIMFPIHNHVGKVVGFTGRILPQFDTGELGKYINSPETAIFNKSKLLYGFWRTKNAIRESKSAFLVEGQMDMLMGYQVGVANIIATSGTALTVEHLLALSRLTDELVVSFDADEAGMAAAERAIELAQAHDFAVRVASFAPHKDPADAAVADPAAFRTAVAAARPAPEFYFSRYLPEGVLDLRERDALRRVRAVLRKLNGISSAVSRDFWTKELAKRTGVDAVVLAEEASRAGTSMPARVPAQPQPAPPPEPRSRRELLSELFVAAAAARGDYEARKTHAEYLTVDYREIFAMLARGERKAKDPGLDAALDLVLLRAGTGAEIDIEDVERHLFEEHVRDRRRHLTAVVKQAERSGDKQAEAQALDELRSLPAL